MKWDYSGLHRSRGDNAYFAGLAMQNHAEQAAHAAFDMLEVMEKFNQENGYKFKIRVGLNSGSVVAGVIGVRKFLYDIWGDVVNTASRMESQGIPGKIQITDSTQARLGKSFVTENMGSKDIVGKGAINTWFLVGRTSSVE